MLFVRHATSAGMRQARLPADFAADVSGFARARAPLRRPPDGAARASPARAALCHALGLDVPAADRIDIAPLSTTGLTAARDGWRVAHVNRKVFD